MQGDVGKDNRTGSCSITLAIFLHCYLADLNLSFERRYD